ncbi:nucleotide sugar dehydrogenase [Gammaproteobacteria bacterium]|nr:nucleotide sugar dehydrogenase [Gammaproteobacteria bacterium]
MIKIDANLKIAIVGMGYVGLPLALEFSKITKVIGFDINKERISALKIGHDSTLEVDKSELLGTSQLSFTHLEREIQACNCFIITVPTPITKSNQPNLDPLMRASKSVGLLLKKQDIVIYESTVYPGATEEECVPILEEVSRLTFNKDFFVGYSPERINPGDKDRSLRDIVKVTSGSTPEAANFVDQLYKSIIIAGTFPVSSIKAAEAAKVIENTQRDVNIGLINELALIFNTLNIDTEEVLNAAGSKWNFIPFRPGLVGGHCIGVDPYYLTYKAKMLGYEPEIILAGRRLNDSMASYIALELVKFMVSKKMHIHGSKILVMGVSFKENCPDIRNSKVIDIVHELQKFGSNVDCFDPWVNPKEALQELQVSIIENPAEDIYDAIILAVAHNDFIEMGIDKIRTFGKIKHVIYDVKYLFESQDTDLRL